jgi:methylisocitrate lyase
VLCKTGASQKRAKFRERLASGDLLRLPGVFSPLVALEAQRHGFDGIYASGAVIAADLALPDIGLTTLTEVATRSEQIARVVDIPTLVDIDTGFGGPLSAARAVRMLEEKGLAGCQIEDQINRKRCGHLDNKTVVPVEEMLARVKAAVAARIDSNFVICARTDARSVEGLGASIARAQAYLDAGADMIFPEALLDEREFETFRRAVDGPLLANMTEFGKSPLLDVATFSSLGFNAVIFPVTSLRLAMAAVRAGFGEIVTSGTQRSLISKMQTRQELYELLRYADYEAFETGVWNFTHD